MIVSEAILQSVLHILSFFNTILLSQFNKNIYFSRYCWLNDGVCCFRLNSRYGCVSNMFSNVRHMLIMRLDVWLNVSMRSRDSKCRRRLCKRLKQINKYWNWHGSIHCSCDLFAASNGRTRYSRQLRSVIMRRCNRVW